HCHLIIFFSHHHAPPDLSTLSLHDALPIFAAALAMGGPPYSRRPTAFVPPLRLNGHSARRGSPLEPDSRSEPLERLPRSRDPLGDRKSTRLNSSHRTISYAVFCLKKKKNKK